MECPTTAGLSGCLMVMSMLTSPLTAQEPPRGPWGPSPSLHEELRIGSLAGPPESTFGSVDDLIVLDDGSIWILDGQQTTILRFDASGAYIGSVGREGEGPGEFRRPQSLAARGPDRALVWDSGLGRATTFDLHGDPIGSFRGPSGMVWSAYHEELMVSDSDIVWVLTTSAFGALAEARGDPDRLRALARDPSRNGWVRFTAEGETLDTVWVPESDSEPEVYGLDAVGTMRSQGDVIRVVGEEVGYTLHVGSRRIEHTSPRVAFTRGERAEIERNERVFAGRRGSAPKTVPRYKSPITGLWIDGHGRIWVHRATEAVEGEQSPGEIELRERYDGVPWTWFEPFVTDVFDADGTFLGQVTFPERRSMLLWAEGDEVWVRETGEYGEHYVVKYRITR